MSVGLSAPPLVGDPLLLITPHLLKCQWMVKKQVAGQPTACHFWEKPRNDASPFQELPGTLWLYHRFSGNSQEGNSRNDITLLPPAPLLSHQLLGMYPRYRGKPGLLGATSHAYMRQTLMKFPVYMKPLKVQKMCSLLGSWSLYLLSKTLLLQAISCGWQILVGMCFLLLILQILLSFLNPGANRLRSQICEVLDTDLIRQQAQHDAVDIYGLANYVITTMGKMCAPVRDNDVKQLKATGNIVALLRLVYNCFFKNAVPQLYGTLPSQNERII